MLRKSFIFDRKYSSTFKQEYQRAQLSNMLDSSKQLFTSVLRNCCSKGIRKVASFMDPCNKQKFQLRKWSIWQLEFPEGETCPEISSFDVKARGREIAGKILNIFKKSQII